MLTAGNVSVAIGHTPILVDVSFTLVEQQVLMMVGPNGSGKTTLVRAIMGQIPYTGSVLLHDRPIKNYAAEELARNIGVLTQQNNAQFSYLVRDVVAIGRYAHQKGLLTGLLKVDNEAIELAMEQAHVANLANRSITTLSGGELQRVYLARVLAQDPKILILDEPTNHLDIEHQIMLFEIIANWVQQPGRAVLSIVHDLNLAYTYGTHALLLKEGRCIAYGEPQDALSSENLTLAYNVDLTHWMQSLLKRWQ